jgi:hypothetical protein
MYCGSCCSAPLTVQAKRKTTDLQWKIEAVRTVEDLGDLAPEPALDHFGGRADKSAAKTGFFYVRQIGDRWYVVDPDGHLWLGTGMVDVSPGPQANSRWAMDASKLLSDSGFNFFGAWSTTIPLEAVPHPLVYTLIGRSGLATNKSSGFMTAFAYSRHVAHMGTGNAAFDNDCIPVFSPDFEAFCDSYAKPLAQFKSDPYLLGYFTDNELPMPKLENYLALDPNDPTMGSGYAAAKAWLIARKGPGATVASITDDDRYAWAGFVFDRYYRLTTAAIRKYDPNHLCLGSKLNGRTLRSPGIFAAAGKYLDVVSTDYYGVWNPAPSNVRQWTTWSGRPVLVAEFYAKGVDSGMGNTTGAGWLVPTQNDRGLFYQTYTLGLLESKTCVGWSWFKYMDNDPNNKSADPSNRDSNKGIVSIDDKAYVPLLGQMRDLNKHIYAAADKFDGAAAP